MAADILLYNTDVVPVGDDQRQHVELTRDIAERFNQRFGETLVVPRGVYPEEGSRIKNLQEPDRLMSTTRGAPQGVVRLIDPPDVIRKKFKTAVTDSGREVKHDPEEKAGVSNLIEIMAVATGASIAEVESRYDGAGYGPFKEDVGEAVVTLLTPFRERYDELRSDESALLGLMKQGAEKAADVANPTLDRMYERMGFVRALVRRAATLGAPFVAAAIAGVLHFADADAVLRFVVCGTRALRARVRRRRRRPSRWARATALRRRASSSRRSATCPSSSSCSSRSRPARSSSRRRPCSARSSRTRCSCSGSRSSRAAGTSGDGIMRFSPRLPNDTATLLLLAVFIIVLLGISHEVDDPASEHSVAISSFGAVALLSVYAVWLWGYLRTGGPAEPALEQTPHVALPFRVAVALLAAAGVGAAFVSDWFVDALGPAIETLGISAAFTGLVIVAIAGNAVENVVGDHARGEGPERPRDLGDQELGRADRGLPLPGARAALALLRAPADVRASARWRSARSC